MKLHSIATSVIFYIILQHNCLAADSDGTDSSGGHLNQNTGGYNSTSWSDSSSSRNSTSSTSSKSSSSDFMSKKDNSPSSNNKSSGTDRFSTKKGGAAAGYINLPDISGYEVVSYPPEKKKDTSQRVKVIEIIDGDTFKCIIDGKEVAIGLYGIDAPEKGQTYSVMSASYFKQLLSGKNVKIKIVENDKYGRAVALVYADNINVNETLVKNGAAWVYPQNCKLIFCDEWNEYQLIAKSLKMFLWDDGGKPVPPWEYGLR